MLVLNNVMNNHCVLHGLVAVLYFDVLNLDYMITDMGLNDQMNSKKQEVLKSDRMKENETDEWCYFPLSFCTVYDSHPSLSFQYVTFFTFSLADNSALCISSFGVLTPPQLNSRIIRRTVMKLSLLLTEGVQT